MEALETYLLPWVDHFAAWLTVLVDHKGLWLTVFASGHTVTHWLHVHMHH